MFDTASVPFSLSRPSARRADRRHSSSGISWLVLALAVLASGILVAASPSAVQAADTDQPSLHYRELQAHAGKKYEFKAGGQVTVPYRPRRGDSTMVDGSLPVALPAAAGVTAAEPGAQPQVASPNLASGTGFLRRETYGFLPYWSLGTGLNYEALSTIAYFGVAANSDGSLCKTAGCANGWNGWISTTLSNVINTAHTYGTRVAFTVESMAWDTNGAAAQTALLSNPTARANLVTNIVNEVVNRGVDGVDLDFEPIASGQAANYTTFVRALRAALDAVHPGYELTFCANGAAGSYDLGGLLAPGGADAVFIMAYDLRGGSPSTTGSIDPMVSNFTRYTLTSVTNYFLTHGAPANQILLGLPWEGRAWSIGPASPTLNAPPASVSVYGQGATGVSYDTSVGLATKDPANTTQCQAGWPVPCVIGWQYDPFEQTAWTAYYGTFNGGQPTWRALYFDDTRSFGAKCDAVDAWNLRGVGVWELGLDDNALDLQAVLQTKFLGVPASYTPVTPTRLLDSRTGLGFGGPLQRGKPQQLQITGVSGLVPAGATAITGNLTVTQQTAKGFLYIGPTSLASPGSSTLNFPVGDDRANGVSVGLASDGSLWITYASNTLGATAHVVFDVTGYYMPNATGYKYKSVTPTRLLDSRTGLGLPGVLHSSVPQTLAIVGAGGGLIPADAVAITGNLTVTQQSGRGYLYVGPEPLAAPGSSTLNFLVGDDRANNVTVVLGANDPNKGKVSITYVGPNAAATTHVIFDITGYYTADATGSLYVPLPPTRLLDTRSANGLAGMFTARNPRVLPIAGRGGVPGSASAITGNLTVTDQTARGFLFLGPTAAPVPTSSNLNFPTNDDRANGVVSQMSGGTVGITYGAVAGARTDAILDVTGYFIPASAP